MSMPLFRRLTLNEMQIDLPFDEIRKRARILVIDDDDDAFPCELLKAEGYNVQYWEKVKNLRELETGEFDVIVLDIFDVAPPQMSADDGLGVLEHIKKRNPAQLVIAYSGQKYDLSQASFWSLADDYLGKPSSLIDCKEKIDELLRRRFTPHYYWQTTVSILKDAGVSDKEVASLENTLVKSLKRRASPNRESMLQGLEIASNTASVVWVLIQVITKFYTPTS
jgi:DNA-binding response OmpR family regulator